MSTFLVFVILVGLRGIASAFDLARGSPGDNVKVVALDTQRSSSVIGLTTRDRQRLAKRHSGSGGPKAVYEGLDNTESFYFANLSMGTPPQHFRLTIDTGSSDMWVNTVNSTLCTEEPDECAVSGTYSPLNSSTMQFINDGFEIDYADGTGASGSYLSETVYFGDSTIQRFQFGAGYNSTSLQGVLGIAFQGLEEQLLYGVGPTYPNLPVALVNANLTNTVAYSLWLNDVSANTGSILFGGVNSAKYHGSLSTVPIVPSDEDDGPTLSIGISGVSFDDQQLGVGHQGNGEPPVFPSRVLLDAGSTVIFLDEPIVDSIYQLVTAVFDEEAGVGYVPCALQDSNSTLTFSFGSANISVPMRELVLSDQVVNGFPLNYSLNYSDGTPACVFGVAYAEGTPNVLGDSFLRSAYVVYDLENNQVALAQTNFNSTCKDEVKEIVKGKDGIPDARPAVSPVTTIPSQFSTRLPIPTDGSKQWIQGDREASDSATTTSGTLTESGMATGTANVPAAIVTASSTDEAGTMASSMLGHRSWGAAVGVVALAVAAL